MKIFIGMETSGVLRRAFAAAGHQVISCDLLPAQDGCETVTYSGCKIDLPPGLVTFHIEGDMFGALDALRAAGWWPDLGIFHPECTYFTVSAAWAFKDPDFVRYPGVGYHMRVKPGTLTGAARRERRLKDLEQVKRIWALPIKRKAIENPVGSLSTLWRKPTQTIQPFNFGDDASKATCLWLDGLLPLESTGYFKPRMVCDECGGVSSYDSAFGIGCQCCGAEAGLLKPRWSNQTNGGQNKLTPSDDRWQDRADTYPGIAAAAVARWAGVSE